MFSLSSWMKIRLKISGVSSSSCKTSVRSSTLFRVTAPPAQGTPANFSRTPIGPARHDVTNAAIEQQCGSNAPHSESLSSEALTFLMYLFASVRMIEETYFSNIAASAAPTRRCLHAPRHLTGAGRDVRVTAHAGSAAHFVPGLCRPLRVLGNAIAIARIGRSRVRGITSGARIDHEPAGWWLRSLSLLVLYGNAVGLTRKA